MKKHRYKISFTITTFIYMSLFFLYLFMMNQYFIVSQKEKDQTIHLALSQFVPEVIEVPELEEEVIVEEVIEPEPEIEEPEPIPEPILIEKPLVVPEPIVIKKDENITKPKPKPKKIVKKKKSKKVAKKKKKRKASRSSSRRAASSRIDPNKKSQFLAKIRAKINRAKSYPRIAQKRGMQGTVKVRFTILKNGKVGNISLRGPKVFHNSAKRAVKKAFPINTKNAPLSLPTSVNLTLRYQLR